MPSALVLLAVYQGKNFLEEQLDSLAKQSIEHVHVLASDDGSNDGSLEILEAAKRTWIKGVFQIIKGPQKGVGENFRSLILHTKIKADYYAFSDQDDIWNNDKLENAISWIASEDQKKTLAYGTRTRIANENGNPNGLSPLFAKAPSFQNALGQNIAGGNTMVMNKKAYELLVKTTKLTGFVSHDWFVYQIITGAGGVFY